MTFFTEYELLQGSAGFGQMTTFRGADTLLRRQLIPEELLGVKGRIVGNISKKIFHTLPYIPQASKMNGCSTAITATSVLTPLFTIGHRRMFAANSLGLNKAGDVPSGIKNVLSKSIILVLGH